MVIKNRNIYLLYLMAAMLVFTFAGCEDIKYRDIPELASAKAIVSITPQKEIYKVGDEITVFLRAEKEKWGNWPYFERSDFSVNGVIGLPSDNEDLKFIMETARYAHKAELNGGRWSVEQKETYVLLKAKTYNFEVSGNDTSEGSFKTIAKWGVTYTDGDTIYSAEVPVVLEGGKKSIVIKVEE